MSEKAQQVLLSLLDLHKLDCPQAIDIIQNAMSEQYESRVKDLEEENTHLNETIRLLQEDLFYKEGFLLKSSAEKLDLEIKLDETLKSLKNLLSQQHSEWRQSEWRGIDDSEFMTLESWQQQKEICTRANLIIILYDRNRNNDKA